MSRFNTEVVKAWVIEETHKNNRKTNTFHGLLLPPATKEWLPLAIETGCDFYHRRLQSTYILEFHPVSTAHYF